MSELPSVSPPGSFRGWLFTVWLHENRNYLKDRIALWAGVLGTLVALDEQTLRIGLVATALLVLTVGAKLAVDAFHFWFASVELK